MERRCLIYDNTKRWLIDLYKTAKLYRYYNLFPIRDGGNGESQMLVSMVDGRMQHGGLSDRLSGIISAFQYCQQNGVEFRLYFVYPFNLELFLEPNEYDWRIEANELSYNVLHARPLYISLFSHNLETQRHYADTRLKRLARQSHLYSNMRYFKNSEFGYYFNKLFRKTQLLENEIARNLALIGMDYISVTFRFQQLLGDFREAGFPTLHAGEERTNLIERSLTCIERLHDKTGGRILVTSDSSTFLQMAAKRFSYVYTVSGRVVHIDCVRTEDKVKQEVYLKSFVDFFMLANAKCIYLAAMEPLYNSYFPEMASWVYGKPFHVIRSF